MNRMRRVGRYIELLGAGFTPARRWRAAAAAFQREDEIEHACSVASWGDKWVL